MTAYRAVTAMPPLVGHALALADERGFPST